MLYSMNILESLLHRSPFYSGCHAAVPPSFLRTSPYIDLPPLRLIRRSNTPKTDSKIMASVTEDPIALWLKLGALDKLEQALLDGYGEQLIGKTSRIPQVARFLKQVPMVQARIEDIHENIVQGKLQIVQSLINNRKFAYCRDQLGATPLHKAVLFQKPDIVSFFITEFSSVLHARDHQGRTPLHYAAVLPDDGVIYQKLLAAGADQNATDVYGHTPDFYLECPGELTIEELREGATINTRLDDEIVSKRKRKRGHHSNNHNEEDAVFRGYSAKPAALKVQIREIVAQGNLEALEELVLHGHGDRLLGETSPNPVVQEFLDTVPGYMEQINDVHRAVVRGRLREVQTLMNHKSLALARDCMGFTPLHKAVLYGHHAVAEHLADNFPDCLSAKDMDQRTPLHYAAASSLKDSREMYHTLLASGSPTNITDNKGRTADHYLQYPEHINLDQLIKKNQLANATYLGNTISRLKSLSPNLPKPQIFFHDRYHLLNANHDQNFNEDTSDVSDEDTNNNRTNRSHLIADRKMMRPPRNSLPPINHQPRRRSELTSAQIRQWIESQDVDKLHEAVLQGYGQKIAKQDPENMNPRVSQYILDDVPRLVERINSIHKAVTEGDIPLLEIQLDEKDFALARDHFGMTPLHRAIILGNTETIRFIIEKFPETVNAKDKEGRTALHYAAAMSRRTGKSHSYRFLLQNGADPRIRDNRDRTAEHYKTHHLAIPSESAVLGARPKARSRSEPPLRPRNTHISVSQISEKVTQALQKGSVPLAQELVLEGHGKHLIGRTSWNEELRHYLKTIPQFMINSEKIHQACNAGDFDTVKTLVEQDENLLRARTHDGNLPIHIAIARKKPSIVRYMVEEYPHTMNMKTTNGRSPIHIAALCKDADMYRLLVDNGADPKVLDSRGRTAEFYMRNAGKAIAAMAAMDLQRSRSPVVPDPVVRSREAPEVPSRQESRKTLLNQEADGQSVADSELNDAEGKTTSSDTNNTDVNNSLLQTVENEQNPLTNIKTEDGDTVSVVDSQINDPANNAENNDEDIDKNETETTESKEKVDDNDNASTSDNDEETHNKNEKQNPVIVIENDAELDINNSALDEEQENTNNDDENNETNPDENDLNLLGNNIIENDDGNPAVELNTEETQTDTADANENKNTDETANAEPQNNEDIVSDEDKKSNSDEKKVENYDNMVGEQEEDLKDVEDEKETDLNENDELETNPEEPENKVDEDENNSTKVDDLQQGEQRPDIEDKHKDELENVEENLKPDKNADVDDIFDQVTSDLDEDKIVAESNEAANQEEELENKILDEVYADEEQKSNNESEERIETNQNDISKDDLEHNEEEGFPDKQDDGDIPDEKDEGNDEENINSENIEKDNESTLVSKEQLDNGNEDVETNDVNKLNEEEQADEEKTDENENTPSETKEEELVPLSDQTLEENLLDETRQQIGEEALDNEAQDTLPSEEMLEGGSANGNASGCNDVDGDDQEKENDASSSHRPPTPLPSRGKLHSKKKSKRKNPSDRLNELVDYWIKEGDLLRLEHVVIAGQGDRLIGKTSDKDSVREFLNLVPTYMEKIKNVHDAVIRGNLAEVRQVLTRKRFALSRDKFGASPLHLAVLHSHTDILHYIVDKFPETLDGPDNEGRTPLHYAAVLPESHNYYNVLKDAGSDTTIKDKKGHTAEYYRVHKDALTLRDLLGNYKVSSAKRPQTVEIWERPGSLEKDSPLSPIDKPPVTVGKPPPTKYLPKEDEIREILRTAVTAKLKPDDAKYALDAMERPLSKVLLEVATLRPEEPITYMTNALQAIIAHRDESTEPPTTTTGDEDSGTEDGTTSTSSSSESLQQRLESLVYPDDHTRMKDENGQTVLHFAAAHSHREGCFYALIRQAEGLLPERDAKYRTCRDVAKESNEPENVIAVDQYVIDIFLNRRVDFLRYLTHNGYDHLLTATDQHGRNVKTLMSSFDLPDMMNIIQEIEDFQNSRNELHSHIKKGYLEGVAALVNSNKELVAARNTKGRCALHIAVLVENMDVLRLLINANSKAVNVPDNLGRTPLHYAMGVPLVTEMGQVLVSSGAIKIARDVKMRTPSYYFIYKREIEKLKEDEVPSSASETISGSTTGSESTSSDDDDDDVDDTSSVRTSTTATTVRSKQRSKINLQQQQRSRITPSPRKP